MAKFFITKAELWSEVTESCEALLKYRLVNLEHSEEPTTAGERKAIRAFKRKLTEFVRYGKAAHDLCSSAKIHGKAIGYGS